MKDATEHSEKNNQNKEAWRQKYREKLENQQKSFDQIKGEF
jgi:hypothetical protein